MNDSLQVVPNPEPVAPPRFAELAGTLLGWMKWGVFVAGSSAS